MTTVVLEDFCNTPGGILVKETYPFLVAFLKQALHRLTKKALAFHGNTVIFSFHFFDSYESYLSRIVLFLF